jgi:hypothetical protein
MVFGTLIQCDNGKGQSDCIKDAVYASGPREVVKTSNFISYYPFWRPYAEWPTILSVLAVPLLELIQKL